MARGTSHKAHMLGMFKTTDNRANLERWIRKKENRAEQLEALPSGINITDEETGEESLIPVKLFVGTRCSSPVLAATRDPPPPTHPSSAWCLPSTSRAHTATDVVQAPPSRWGPLKQISTPSFGSMARIQNHYRVLLVTIPRDKIESGIKAGSSCKSLHNLVTNTGY